MYTIHTSLDYCVSLNISIKLKFKISCLNVGLFPVKIKTYHFSMLLLYI